MIKWHFSLLTIILLTACSKGEKLDDLSNNEDFIKWSINQDINSQLASKFDPYSLVQLSIDQKEFPYFSLPEDYKVTGFKVLDYQKYYFAINHQAVMLEGELYRTPINVDANKQFSESYFEKKFDSFMLSMGAQKLNNSAIPYGVYESLTDYAQHSELNPDKTTHTYGFRNKQGNPVIIQMTLNPPVVVVMEIKPDNTKMKKVRLKGENTVEKDGV